MNWLAELTREKIEKGPLPLKEPLKNSLYYPSAGFDGGVVKDCNTIGAEHQMMKASVVGIWDSLIDTKHCMVRTTL